MKILVTGLHGFVGARLKDTLSQNYQVISFQEGALRTMGEQEIAQFVCETCPQAIVHSAAISDIGTCEQHKEESMRANVEIPLLLSKIAQEKNIKLLAFSSDQVYTGCKGTGAFTEKEPLNPQNTYAEHKLLMEQKVQEQNPSSVLLRATWMYDMPLYHHKNRGNILVNLLNAARLGTSVTFSTQDYRGLTYVRQVAQNTEKALSLQGGVYNFGSQNTWDMYHTVQGFLNQLGLSHAVPLIENQKALPRSLNMDITKLKSQGICFDGVQEGFKQCLIDYNILEC